MMIGMPIALLTRLEVLVKPFLRRLVVIRGDDQDGVGAGPLGMAGERDRLGRVVRARPGNHRYAPARLVDADVDGALVLVVRQRRAFAGRADRNEPVRSGRDLPVDQGAIGGFVDRAILEGRHKRRHGSMKLCALFHIPLPARPAAEHTSRSPGVRTHRPGRARAKGGANFVRRPIRVNQSSAMSAHPGAEGLD